MFPKLLLDTNVVIEKSQLKSDGLLELRKIGQKLFISTISISELFCLPGLSSREEKEMSDFISEIEVLPVDYDVAYRAAVLFRTRPNKKYRNDLMIAASALVFNIPILTKNQRDFARIPDLKIV